MFSLVSGFFHSTFDLWNSSIFIACHSNFFFFIVICLSLLYSCVNMPISLTIVVGYWVILNLGLLWIKMLWTFYVYAYMHTLLGFYPRVELWIPRYSFIRLALVEITKQFMVINSMSKNFQSLSLLFIDCILMELREKLP